MPEGKEGKGPEGRFQWPRICSQKQRGQSCKSARDEGDKL